LKIDSYKIKKYSVSAIREVVLPKHLPMAETQNKRKRVPADTETV
jgi:hypothetical protein